MNVIQKAHQTPTTVHIAMTVKEYKHTDISSKSSLLPLFVILLKFLEEKESTPRIQILYSGFN
jgi:hypothetical protein